MFKKAIPAIAISILLFFSSCNTDIKVACVGDSITEGHGLISQSQSAYPSILGNLLGSGYSVLNAGQGGATLLKDGDFPYWNCNEFSNVFDFQPDIIVIKLGTNDTKIHNWDADKFSKDYQALIDTFNTINSHPRIILCIPVPVFKTAWGINDSTLTHGVIPVINEIGKTNQLTIIDLYSKMKDYPDFFPDGIHPIEGGTKIMAEIVAEEINITN
jgi:alpha-L-fucosidase 2